MNSFETIEMNIKNDQNEVNRDTSLQTEVITILYLNMPRTVIVSDVKQLTDHYLRQQHGGSIAGLCGAHIQREYGIGGIFKSLARFAIPLFKKSAKAVGKRALQAVMEIGQDVLEGKSITKSAKSRKNKWSVI